MNTEARPLSELVGEAVRLLVAQIGPANTARVINYFSIGYGNYTEERKQAFECYGVDDIIREINENEIKKEIITKA